MDHSELVAEFPVIEKLTPAERIQLARERRALQLNRNRERETQHVIANSNVLINDRKPRAIFKPSIVLLEATSRNDLDEVRRLLAAKSDPNARNEDGLTPLHQCAIDNNEAMLKLFLEFGADVNSRDTELWTPLHAAACCGHVNIVKRLIDNGADLLSVNADGNMPYDICDDDYTLDYIESEMAKRGVTQEDIDQERLKPERQMLADMQALKEKGGNLEYKDEFGATPLHVASANGFYSCGQFLLDNGVSTHVRDDDGWQPVHAAACWAQPDMLELLVAYSADINARTPTGETPFDLCEDESVRAVIMSLQVEAQRRRLLSFARDSRRMSKRRKPTSKFESPSPSATPDNHLVATRGAIRRLSIRDRAGVTLARLEARREAALMRSWSFEDTSTKQAESPDSNEAKKDDKSGVSNRNGGASVQLVGGKSAASIKLPPVAPSNLSAGDTADLENASDSTSINNAPKLHKLQSDERKPKQGSTKRGKKKSASGSLASPMMENATNVVGNGSTTSSGAGAYQMGISEDPLKRQRSDDGKSSGSKAKGKVKSTSAGQQLPRRRKMGLRCCTIT